MKGICRFEGCERELRPGSRFAECAVCRANINAWERRRPVEVLVRRTRLNLYTMRMEGVIGGRRARKKGLAARPIPVRPGKLRDTQGKISDAREKPAAPGQNG